MNQEREESERRVRAAFDAEDFDTATTSVIEDFGPEIFGFLVARLRSESDASEVFSDFTLDLWKGLPGFQWRCPVRVWAYTLARHAANRYTTAPQRKPARNIPLSQAKGLSQLGESIRSRTLAHLRTETKSRMAVLRERLPIEDQTVLILRVDKNLSWNELALVMSYDGEEPGGDVLKKEAARLRKRFQLAKERLKKMAKDEGLLD